MSNSGLTRPVVPVLPYLKLYVLRLRCLLFVARNFTKVRPVGSKTHRTVIQTLRMTTQLQTTIPSERTAEILKILFQKQTWLACQICSMTVAVLRQQRLFYLAFIN